ncbi:DUF1553 domain-containing protein [Planctomicrobium sp. SH661]|uniref:DUF1553 domain-containing protein n=1 Tax=Planctomicrobium sp. SH661 TaxID=3448124 RepID=UPI003F5C014F
MSRFVIMFVFVATFSIAHGADPVPVAHWDFGEEEPTPLQSHGGVHRDQPGPRPPTYPDFGPDNTAVKLDGDGAYLSFDDPGTGSRFDFTNGDEITLEAWVQLTELHSGENVYLIGKGRTGAPNFNPDNQNWALRVREQNGKASVSFLFATESQNKEKGGHHWHRWTSESGFLPGPAWHHVAISYRFGDPSSIRGWIDGQLRKGRWDLGGETRDPPVVDNDSIWIGSSMQGYPASSLRGSLDAIAVYRELLSDDVLKARYRRSGEEPSNQLAPEVSPELGALPGDNVLLTFREGMPAHDRWLEQHEKLPGESLRWETETFLIDQLPQRYDDWGIRENWQAPVLMTMATEFKLSPGPHRFLMRTRGLSRLWVNGQVIARSQPVQGSPSGEEPVTPLATPPHPHLRRAEHRQQEVIAEATIGSDGNCRVILETLVGGKNFRTDPGETCVAVETDDRTSFVLLRPRMEQALPLTDAAVSEALQRQHEELQVFNDERRRKAAASQDPFWNQRHNVAKDWARQHPAPSVPSTSSSEHPIDAFLQAKIQTALAVSSTTNAESALKFHTEILPILRDNCLRCHGDKGKGGLMLDSLSAARQGGDTGLPAITPGDLKKSEIVSRIHSQDPDERMPPGGVGLATEKIALLEEWIRNGAEWPPFPVKPEEVAPTAVLSDEAFLRRLSLDTVGVIPSIEELQAFLLDSSPDKRRNAVDRLLADPRWADHWMGYWQDVLAENPTLINTSLNTTGPFRWFLYDSLRDNKAFDRLVTELILLRGSPHEGGSAGFAIAGNNDAPMAAKGQIVASAFLGIELQCARCHDSPYHSTTQQDLYALAAMFEKKQLTVPASSRVPSAFFEKKQRESLIQVTLKPDQPVPPAWPFAAETGCADDDSLNALMQNPQDTRERLAALMTAPANARFPQVIVNRIWRKLIGAGIVEPPADWEGHAASHPDLLEWLAREFITHDYDLKHVARLILTSELYQREASGSHQATLPELRFFNSPDRRRMTAEQVVDSLSVAGGQPLQSEELTFDPDGRRASSGRLTLGIPKRAWMFANLANERDRPSLNLPRARTVTDVMEAFGWSGARQSPRTDRETAASVLQPGVLENSTLSVIMTRASLNSGLATQAVAASSPDELVEAIFLRFLSRRPSAAEKGPLVADLAVDFERRVLPENERSAPPVWEPLPVVTWSNHLRPESNTIVLELESRARAGLPADPRLRTEWRETYEDVVWSVMNLGEFVWVP